MMLPRLSESLAGRMEILTLWPFSQGEIAGRRENFIDAVSPPDCATSPAAGAARTWLRESCGADTPRSASGPPPCRRAWFNSYLTTILQRDVRELSNIEALSEIPRLLTLLAARIGSLLNVADISRSLAVSYSTLNRYLALLQATFLVQPLPPWFANVGKRLVKSPKAFLNDTGLAANLLGINSAASLRAAPSAGGIVENFVAMEAASRPPGALPSRSCSTSALSPARTKSTSSWRSLPADLWESRLRPAAASEPAISAGFACWPRKRARDSSAAWCSTKATKSFPLARTCTPFRSAPCG